MEITFENLPNAVNNMSNDINEIKRLLLEKSNENPTNQDRWFDLNELCSYLPDKPAKPTVYGWVQSALIPCHKGAKRLRFLKSEIDAWLKQGRKKTIEETSREADQYLLNRKKGLNHGR